MERITNLSVNNIKNNFNYNQLNATTSEFLQIKEINMRKIATDATTQMGKELKEAQDELSKHGYGCFEEWYTSLGFKKDAVYRLIQRYDLIVANCEEQNLLESLPKSLIYEVAKPSANQQLKQKVLDGDITTLKEYKELEKAKKEADKKAEQLELSNKTLQDSYNELSKKYQEEKNKEPEQIEVEIDNTDYDTIGKLTNELESLKKDNTYYEKKVTNLKTQLDLHEKNSKEYEQLKIQMDLLIKQKDDIGRQIESATLLSGLIVNIQKFIENELAPIRYSRAIVQMRGNDIVNKNLSEIINVVDEWSQEIKQYLNKNNNIINVEVN